MALTLPDGAWTAALRLGAAVAIGGAIGINRDLKDKPAGFRTHAIVALSGALLTYVTLAFTSEEPSATGEISRVIQGIVTGIGFLGAGVIIRPVEGRRIHGLTTAATIWLAAVIGVGCGLGQWMPMALGTVLAFLVLIAGGAIERLFHRIFRADQPPRPPE